MTYILLIHLESDVSKFIGSLGKMNFKSGYYAYVGSAKKNFDHRIKRHLEKNKKLFWHIDYLLADKSAKVKEVFYTNKTIEHKVAMHLCKLGLETVEKFGSSDCNCSGHLFYLKRSEQLKKIIKDLGFKNTDKFTSSQNRKHTSEVSRCFRKAKSFKS